MFTIGITTAEQIDFSFLIQVLRSEISNILMVFWDFQKVVLIGAYAYNFLQGPQMCMNSSNIRSIICVPVFQVLVFPTQLHIESQQSYKQLVLATLHLFSSKTLFILK